LTIRLQAVGNMQIQSYRDLVVWQRAMELVERVYAASQKWPMAEIYGLKSQVRRAAVSVPSNIAEGHGRSSRGDYRHHIGIAHGSLMEVETQIILAQRLGYITAADAAGLTAATAEIGRMLNGLAKALSPRGLTPDP
jgi:four helix bundle protein